METLTKDQIKSAKRVYDTYTKFISTFFKSTAFLSQGIHIAIDAVSCGEDFPDESIETLLEEVYEYGKDCIDITETVLNQEWFYLRGTELYDSFQKFHQVVIKDMLDQAYQDELDQITDVDSLYEYTDKSDLPKQLTIRAIDFLDSIIENFIPQT